MENKFSKFKDINFKEVTLGFIITLATALLDLLWQGANPMIQHLQETLEFDFSLFTTKVNFGTAWDVAIIVASTYFPAVFFSGKKQE